MNTTLLNSSAHSSYIMRLMKLFQKKTLVTEDVLSHYYEVDSVLFN